jgi:NAD-dependent dihydropyrimidine dehydrogenase PreA subunit
MAKKLTVVVSQGQSANPAKRKLEEEIVAGLLFERGIEVTVIPNLYDLAPDGTGMLCLHGIAGDMVVLSWLFPRAAHWTLDRNGIRGREGKTLLVQEPEDQDDLSDETAEQADAPKAADTRPMPSRNIYCIDLRAATDAAKFIEEVGRIRAEANVETISLGTGSIGLFAPRSAGEGAAGALPLNSAPANGNSPPEPAPLVELDGQGDLQPTRIDEQTGRRWYPVIDYSRCTNCLECLDFCLFGVYGVAAGDSILVEQPDNCRKGCPACSRVCPENAIIFPQHKSPAIAGSPDGEAGGLKIDLSRLFGAPDALEVAVLERDVELVAVGRDAVGTGVGMPKRQLGRETGPKDELDNLMDELDNLDL